MMCRPFVSFMIAAFVGCPTLASAQLSTLLRANSSSQLIQNEYADRTDLSRMKNVRMIQQFARSGYLVPVPVATKYYYLHQISPKYRYLRPWTKLFLDRLAQQHYARFGRRLRVTSLVRTIAMQEWLTRTNGNAAPAWGNDSSSHLTGATLDISKKGMSYAEVEWMRRVIYSLRQQGYLYGIEEFDQPVFHVMVYRRYANYVKGQTSRAREKRFARRKTAAPRREEKAGRR